MKRRLHNYRHNIKRRQSKFITNRSSHPLSTHEIALLEKGLSFIPMPKRREKSDILHDLSQFTSKLTERSNNLPQSSKDKLSEYITQTKQALKHLRYRHPRDNLTPEERTALHDLSKNRDIVVKKTDKGNTIVIDDKDEYIQDCTNHLNDPHTYNKLPTDPTTSISKDINRYLKNCHRLGLIDKTTLDACLPPEKPRTQKFYMLRKMHKNPKKLRPIVSGCNGPTEHISSFIDTLLQPAMKATPSYIRDSKQFINLLESLKMPPHTILLTIDVTSLYTNIPQEEGISACIEALQDLDLPHKPPEDVIRMLMTYILEYNTFEFNGEFFQQTCGTAMGTKMAPAFATIFMHKLEQAFLNTQTYKPLTWIRYIDDIFAPWTHGEEKLQTFLHDLNDFHPNIKFTYETDQDKATYLDIDMYKGTRFRQQGILDIKTHFKPTNTFQYVHGSSCHPISTYKSIAKGECMRFLRSNSDPDTYKTTMDSHIQHLQNRNFPENIIQNTHIPFTSRPNTLEDKPKNKLKTPPFVTTYTPWLPQLTKLVHMHWTNIQNDASLQNIFPEPPITALRANKNIAKHLVRADLKAPPKTNNRPHLRLPSHDLTDYCQTCTHSQCSICPFLRPTAAIQSSATKIIYPINTHYTCTTPKVIYLITCTVCSKQYVGQTAQNLRLRFRHHRNHMHSHTQRPIYRHFNQHNFTNITIQIIEQELDDLTRYDRERHWIRTLKTYIPKGLNSKFDIE